MSKIVMHFLNVDGDHTNFSIRNVRNLIPIFCAVGSRRIFNNGDLNTREISDDIVRKGSKYIKQMTWVNVGHKQKYKRPSNGF